jgi:hypothetical protein
VGRNKRRSTAHANRTPQSIVRGRTQGRGCMWKPLSIEPIRANNLGSDQRHQLYKRVMIVRGETNLFAQCACITTAHVAIQRSTTASKKSPIQVPTIAPVLLGTQPRNHNMSPVVKWRYGSIWPMARSMLPSMDISIPLLCECAATRETKLRAIRRDIGVRAGAVGDG